METAKFSPTPSAGVESSYDDNLMLNSGLSNSSNDARADAGSRASTVSAVDASEAASGEAGRARALVAEGRLEEAQSAARSAASAAESRGDKALLAECLTTLGVAEARAGRREAARATLMRASETAEAAGDRACAGRAALALAEEFGDSLNASELRETFERAYSMLAGTHDPEALSRLNECARRAVAAALAASRSASGLPARDSGATPEERWANFSLKSEVLRYEAELIERALKDAGGVVSHAAKLLGFRHHQTFVALLNNRHRSLLHARTPVVPRRRSVTVRAHRMHSR
jgi:tetratricopeptide (TPR) repeat protein